MPESRSPLTVAGLIAACLSAIVLAGCGPNQEPAEIRILGEDSSNLQAMKELTPIFENEMASRGRRVKVTFEAASFADAMELANQDFRSGAGKYDVVLQYNFSLAEYASRDYVFKINELATIVPDGLQDQVSQGLFRNVWHEVGYYYKNDQNRQGGIEAVGYPFAANTMLLVYNRAMFEDREAQAKFLRRFNRELRPPTSWEELRETAQFFTDRSRSQCGIALQGAGGGWLYYEWMNFLNGFGGRTMSKSAGWEGGPETLLELNTPVAEQAAAYYASLKPYNCGDFFSTDAPVQREAMLGGNVSMAIMWSDYVHELVDNGRKKGMQFGFAALPGGKSMIGGGAFFVNRKSNHPDLAAQFVMFLLRQENQVDLVRQGLCSPIAAVYTDASLQSVPYAEALGVSLRRATYMLEAGPDAELISTRITEALQRIWRGETPGPVLRQTQENLQRERAELFARRLLTK